MVLKESISFLKNLSNFSSIAADAFSLPIVRSPQERDGGSLILLISLAKMKRTIIKVEQTNSKIQETFVLNKNMKAIQRLL